MPVLSDGGQPISIPDEATDITISGDGFITAQVGTGSTRAQLGKLGVVKFDDEQQVMPIGGGLFTTAQTGTPVTNNAVVQGMLEQSNVKPISEMTSLIRIQRAYEQASNMISNENSRLSDALDKLSAS
jgi:flagellar basal-body rod protein FlgF